MAKTKADLRNAALRYLSVLPEGQAATAHQTTTVETVIDSAQGELEADGVAYWAISAIPDAVFLRFRNYVAALAAPELMEPDRAAPYAAGEAAAKRKLVDLTSSAATSAPMKHRYF